jgi:hypothetical protein
VITALIRHSTATGLPVTLIPTGLIAVILGSHASKAFDNIGGAFLVRFLGAVMLIGGTTIVTGIIRTDPAYEPIGLTFVSLGLGIYGTGVIIGLGTQGLIAGMIAIGAGLGFLGRVLRLIRAAPPRE